MTYTDPDPEDLADAAAEVVDCMRVLAKGGSSLVLEALGGRDFVELEHYPPGDIHDPETHSQAYFHAHPPSPSRPHDFGHFHTFLCGPALPPAAPPLDLPGNPLDRPAAAVTTHLVAIAMDNLGRPTALFTTNQWVTDETLYPAPVLAGALPSFALDLAHPSWPLNRWLTAMVVLFRPTIAALLAERDSVLARAAAAAAEHDAPPVLQDRRLEVLSHRPIDLTARLAEVRRLIGLDEG